MYHSIIPSCHIQVGYPQMVTKDDPLVTQDDQRLTLDDPWVTQNDPRVTQYDPRVNLRLHRVAPG